MSGDPRTASATYLDDETYARRRRRNMGALITVGVLTVVAIDVTAAIQWATGTRTPTDSITTLLMSVAMVVVATWHATHPHRTHCWPGYPVGACMTAPSALGNNDDGTLPSTDEGDQR